MQGWLGPMCRDWGDSESRSPVHEECMALPQGSSQAHGGSWTGVSWRSGTQAGAHGGTGGEQESPRMASGKSGAGVQARGW